MTGMQDIIYDISIDHREETVQYGRYERHYLRQNLSTTERRLLTVTNAQDVIYDISFDHGKETVNYGKCRLVRKI